MMSMRSKQQRPSQTTGSRYDRMAAPGHINMNSGVNWSDFVEDRERKGGNQLPAIGGSSLNHSLRKRTPLSTAEFGTSDRYTILPEIDGIDIDKELRESLSTPLKDVSRQRLRAIRISFRRLSNTDNRISTKDILVVLGEHNVRISNRTYQMIIRKFETEHGVDYEGLWKYMVEAQSNTGRDSIQAINQNKQTTPQPIQQLDTADIALVASISKALKTSSEYDLEEMRSVCQMRDISRHGLLPRKLFRRICLDQHIPLGATLMRTMLKRCDDEKNGLISWPEFIMLLEKGANLTPEQNKTPTKRPPPAVYKPQKKPPSPKASLHLPSHDTKPKEFNKAGSKPRPKSTTVPSHDSKPKETVDNSMEKPPDDAQDASTGNVPEVKDNLKASDAAVIKQPAGSKVKPKESPVKPKLAGKGKKDEDTLSIKSLPAQRKGKVITWNNPITVPTQTDQPTASAEQGQTSNGHEEEVSKTPVPSETANKLENDDTKAIRSEASLELNERPEFESQEQGVGSEPMNATEEEYLKKAQERISGSGSEITLNDPSSENSSAISDPKDEINPDAGDSLKSPKDDDAVSVVLSETVNNTDVLNAAESNQDDVDGSETSSVLDREETESQKSLHLQQPIKPKGKPSTPNEKKIRAVYGKNPRRPVPSPVAKRDKEKKTAPTGRTAAAKKVPSARKHAEIKTTKVKSSTSSVRGETKNKKEKTVESVVASPPANERSDSNLQEPDVETKSVVSQSSNDSRDYVLPKIQSSPSPSLNADLLVDDGEDSLSQHLLEVEKANNPVPEEFAIASAEGPLENPESPLPPAREEDGETASFVIRGQEVSYYKPDAYIGKETSTTEGPNQTLELDWIYGYRGNDCRCNLWAIEDGVLVYFIGKVAILYNSEDHTQRHYTQHTAEIKSLAVHSSNVIMATGQAAGQHETGQAACIHVWSAETLETLYTAGEGYFEKAVLCLNFCKQEDYLVAVDDSDEHTMSIWHSSSGERLADSVLLTEVVCQVAFHPTNPNQLVSVGKEHLCFWQLQKDPYTIEETMIANYETKMKAKYVICLTFHPNGALLTGDSNGTIYLWHKDGHTIAHTITHAHNGPVFWLMYNKNTLISGGRDGIIQTYSLSSKGTDFTGKLQLPQVEGGVRTIQTYKDKMYIGTTLNCILSANITVTGAGPLVTGATINNAPITQGHYDEVHCIATHPTKKNHFFTAAYDGIVCLYDASLHKALWKYVVKGINATCMDVGQNGEIIILGAKDGHLVVLTIGEEEVQETNRIKLGRQPIYFVKFAPGGEIFAAGCHDIILILKIVDSGKTLEPLGKCQGHVTAVTAFDWSTDDGSGKLYLQSSSVSHEYFCWDIGSCKVLEYSSDYRNASWISQHCLSGYTRAGVWGTSEESPFVNSIDWNEDQCLLISGSNDGVMSLFKYPCLNQESDRSIQAHCKDAPIVRFLPGGSMVLSAGGSDCATIQWMMKG